MLSILSEHPFLKEKGITLSNDAESLIGLVVLLLSEIQKRDEIIEKQNEIIEKQNKEIRLLRAEVEQLKIRLNKNSKNSHKPPSSDPYRKAATPRKRGGKRGGQVGHKGKGLERLSSTEVIEVKVEADRCECGEDLTQVTADIAEVRQVQDIPKAPVRVTDFAQQKKTCPCCGKEHLGEFPKGVRASVQYGNNLKALCVLLCNDYKVPIKRVSQLIEDLYGLVPNVAIILNYNAKAYEQMESLERQIKESILSSPVAHSDETGWRVAGRCNWLHVASTSMFTYLFTHKNRGLKALISELSLIKDYMGKLVHDSYVSYFKILNTTHALCGAHIIRELTAQEERGREWAVKMKRFLLRLKEKEAKENVKNKDDLLLKEYREILFNGKKEEPPPERKSKRGKLTKSKGLNLIERLETRMNAVLLHAFDPEVPFTNNQAERDFRFAKVKMNVSHCFRSTTGAKYYARIMSVISTARKHNMNIFDTLKSIFENEPIYFAQKGT